MSTISMPPTYQYHPAYARFKNPLIVGLKGSVPKDISGWPKVASCYDLSFGSKYQPPTQYYSDHAIDSSKKYTFWNIPKCDILFDETDYLLSKQKLEEERNDYFYPAQIKILASAAISSVAFFKARSAESQIPFIASMVVLAVSAFFGIYSISRVKAVARCYVEFVENSFHLQRKIANEIFAMNRAFYTQPLAQWLQSPPKDLSQEDLQIQPKDVITLKQYEGKFMQELKEIVSVLWDIKPATTEEKKGWLRQYAELFLPLFHPYLVQRVETDPPKKNSFIKEINDYYFSLPIGRWRRWIDPEEDVNLPVPLASHEAFLEAYRKEIEITPYIEDVYAYERKFIECLRDWSISHLKKEMDLLHPIEAPPHLQDFFKEVTKRIKGEKRD